MKFGGGMFLVLLLPVLLAGTAAADGPVYREPNKYPILDEIKAAREADRALRDSVREAVEAEWEAQDKALDVARQLCAGLAAAHAIEAMRASDGVGALCRRMAPGPS